MRHVIIRSIIALAWLVVAVVSVIKQDFSMTAFYFIIGVVFGYFAYSAWRNKKDESDKKGR